MDFMGTLGATAGLPIPTAVNDLSIVCDKPLVCGYQLFLGMFFDGTGNNKNHEKADKNSNVAKLWKIYTDLDQDTSSRLYRKHYMPGVGTAFEAIGENNGGKGNYLGSAFGNQGQSRIDFALIQTMNEIHKVLYYGNEYINKLEAEDICQDTSSGSIIADKFDDLAGKVEEKRKEKSILQINLSVFGFSRGAAEARSFVNQLLQLCGGTQWAGIRFSYDFLGIFDTVASVASADIFGAGIDMVFGGHWGWATPSLLRVPSAVKLCVHIVAATEGRACFPSDLVHDGTAYPSNCEEWVMPGSHSDVGGGYATGDYGTPLNHIPRIALHQIYKDALRSGVPLQTVKLDDDLFSVSDDLAKAYNRYTAAVTPKIKGGIEYHLRMHYGVYWGWRSFSDLRNNPLIEITTDIAKHYREALDADQEERANSSDTANLIKNIGSQVLSTPFPDQSIINSVRGFNENGLMTMKDFGECILSVGEEKNLEGKLDDIGYEGIVDIFMFLKEIDEKIGTLLRQYVHDSAAGFIDFLRDGAFGMIPNGEWSLNNQGPIRHRRIYAGGRTSIHREPTTLP